MEGKDIHNLWESYRTQLFRQIEEEKAEKARHDKGTRDAREKADLDNDGNIEPYEKKRANAIRDAEGKEHLCAKEVKHENFGQGKCIPERHAYPDQSGNVSWYCVVFEHGTEVIDTTDLEVLASETHMH